MRPELPGIVGVVRWRSAAALWPLAWVLASHLAATSAMAQKPPGLTAGEISLLPVYCTEAMGMRPGAADGAMGPNANHWFGLMGRSFLHMHHFCWAQVNIRRAQMAGVNAKQREALLSHAIGDLDYVLINAEPTFIMLPDIYLTIGQANALMKRHDLAVLAYTEAQRRKPDYWRPYSSWGDSLLAVGDRRGAVAVLEQGLLAAGPQPNLIAQYKRLGGNPETFLSTAAKRAPGVPVSAAPQAMAASAPPASEPASATR